MFFKNILNKEYQVVMSAAFMIGFFSFLSKILGLIRNRIFAGEFGAGDTLDIYFAAFRIPDFIYNLLIIGVLGSVFIPVFAEYLARGKKEAWRFANNVLTVFAAGVAIFSIVAIIFAPQIISLIAFGFDAQKQQATVALTRIMFLSPLLLGISSIIGSILQTNKMFFSFAVAPVFYNIGIILGAVFFVDFFGIIGLAIGVALGAFLHLIINLLPLLHLGFKFRPVFDLTHPGLRKVFWLSLPRTVGLAAYQLNFIVITALASAVSAGSISVFNFANDLQYVPIGIVALSFVTAVFPALSSSWAEGDVKGFLDELYLSVNQILFLVIPISIFLILERAQIVRVILGYGAFSWEDTRLTAAALGAFAISIFAQSLIPLFSRAFYAISDTKTPVFINVVCVFINIFLSFWFLRLMDGGGQFFELVGRLLKVSDMENISVLALPLAFSVSSIINFLWLYFAFSTKISEFDSSKILTSIVKINIAVALMAVAIYPTLRLVAGIVDMHTFAGIFLQGVSAFLVGLTVYSVVSYLLKISEFFAFWEALYLPVRKLFLSRLFPVQVNGSEKL